MQLDEGLSKDVVDYVERIHKSGMVIEQMLSDIDYYLMDDVELEELEFDLTDLLNDFFTDKNDANDKKFNFTITSTEKLKPTMSKEIFKRVLNNLYNFSKKGLKTTKNRQIDFFYKPEGNKIYLIYSDTSEPIYIQEDFFNFEEILKAKRGLGLLFVERYVEIYNGNIKYLHSKKWNEIIGKLGFKTENKHGFIYEFDLSKKPTDLQP